MNYPLASVSWDHNEYQAAMQVLSQDRYTMGNFCKKFEQEFADFTGTEYSVFCNSGSSANLLGLAAIKYDPRRRNEKRNKVIVPAVSWSTTYHPVSQLGYELVFVDVDSRTFNISPTSVKKALTDDVCGIVSVNLLGNPCNYNELLEIAADNDIWLFEDNCESMGAKFSSQNTGTFGLVASHSSFFSHHIATMEGGICTTNDELIYEVMKSLRAHGWTRDVSNTELFYRYFPRPANDFYQSFHFVLPGYNFRPTEIQGALGSAQLQKLSSFISHRINNASFMENNLQNASKLTLQEETVGGISSWFGFGFLVESKLKKYELIDILHENNIECRPIVSGNMLRQPVFANISTQDSFDSANKIHDLGIMIGNHQKDITSEISHFLGVIDVL